VSNDQIKQAYEKYTELEAQIKELKNQLKPLEKEQSIHEAVLLKGIKEDETKSGIHHKVMVRKTPRYKDIFSQVYERFVPKTKQKEVDVIVEELTTVTKTHVFETEA